jgi:hypothetical protein
VTHAVALGESAGVPATVYDGPIDPATPQRITLPGGSATVAGVYTLRAELLDSASAPIARTSVTITVAGACPEPMPEPSAGPSPAAPAKLPDIQWSQGATPSRGAAVGAIVVVAVRGANAGAGTGGSAGILGYDPALLRLLDAQPSRADDWVRDRDDAAGMLTLAFGPLAPQERATLVVRFRVLGPTAETVIRLTREDGEDRGNPLVLSLGATRDGPLSLDVTETATQLVLRGRGYKPGEPLAVWGNTVDGRSAPIAAPVQAGDDDAGTVTVQLGPLDESITSLVVMGKISGVTSTATLTAPASTP